MQEMCGIDDAIQHIEEDCSEMVWKSQVVNRLEYHKRQAIGIRPTLVRGDTPVNSFYKCGNCGIHLEIVNNYCPGCGYKIQWNSARCLTGLPLIDATEEKTREKLEKLEEKINEFRND